MIDLSISQTNRALKEKKFTATELTHAYLNQIERIDKKLNAFVTVTKEVALDQAKKMDEKGDFSNPLAGIPMNLKDIICTDGIRTTASSKILENFVPPYNAHVYDRLLQAGAVLLGKTNTDEFAMGSSTENSFFGPTKNPWNLECVSGGSSGGPAASVSANLSAFSLGSDTGGSIRLPASFCSMVGLKVTYGRVPRHGCIAYASSFDTIGPFAKTVEDAALVLQTIGGQSEKDATTVNKPVPNYSDFLKTNLEGLKLGIPKEYFAEGVEKEVVDTVMKAIEEMKKLGAEVIEVSLPLTKYAIPAYYLLAKSEGSTNMARYDGIKYGRTTDQAKELEEIYMKSRSEGFGDEVKRTIMIGTYALSAGYYDAFYLKAAKVRALIKQEFEEAFKACDALITPTSPILPFKIGEKASDPLAMYMADILTTPINLAGIPALSLPAGFSSTGLPIGMQIIAGQFEEGKLFHIGNAFEKATEWHLKKPEL